MKFSQLQKAKQVLIYGCGKEGLAAHEFITRKFSDLRLSFHDDKKNSQPDFSLFDVIVVSPGVSPDKLQGVDKKKITSVTDLFFDNISDDLRRKVIGVTGTKGKSTTVKFIAEMLAQNDCRVAIGGNFGKPLLKIFTSFIKGRYDYVVVELSSYQLESLRVSPGIAMFLNLFPDHLDRHGTIAKYRRAKTNIFRHQKFGDILIVPKKWKTLAERHEAILSSPAPANLFPAGSIFRAAHFLDNFGTIISLASCLGISKSVISKTAKNFKGLRHRLELIAKKRGIEFYDDAISTNPDSTMAGVVFFRKKLGTIILGGQDRKQNFRALIEKLKDLKVYIIILRSETAVRILKTALAIGYEKISEAKNMSEAISLAARATPRGKICLLSTAAPSYGIFKNYKEKGKAFKRCIFRL
jgi:UDP-N-acetylmuramoylalanine--D-glutamate ligase